MEKNYASSSIEAFLDFIRDAESLYRMSEADEQDANNLTQDILHKVELELTEDDDLTIAAKLLKSVRQQRREAKDVLIQLIPVKEWTEANSATIKNLQKLLGSVRKAENSIENRFYNYKYIKENDVKPCE